MNKITNYRDIFKSVIPASNEPSGCCLKTFDSKKDYKEVSQYCAENLDRYDDRLIVEKNLIG